MNTSAQGAVLILWAEFHLDQTCISSCDQLAPVRGAWLSVCSPRFYLDRICVQLLWSARFCQVNVHEEEDNRTNLQVGFPPVFADWLRL